VIQANAYSGFNKLYEFGADGEQRIIEAACWAHLRRDFHDFWKSTDSPIAKQALDQIGALYHIEREIAGKSAEIRGQVRQSHSARRVESFRTWCEAQVQRFDGKSDLAKAIWFKEMVFIHALSRRWTRRN
jgi:hypothetical protein